MSRLLTELTARGDLYEIARPWLEAYQDEQDATVTEALLQLDLIDEDGLLRGLQSSLELPAAKPADLAAADPNVVADLPSFVSRLSSMCPLKLVGDELVVVVARPLSNKTLKRLQALDLDINQLVAPAHHVAIARQRVFGAPIDAPASELEQRLARRRSASVRRALERIEAAPTWEEATAVAVEFAAQVLDFSCLFMVEQDQLGITTQRGGQVQHGPFDMPNGDCTLGEPLASGAPFVGPLAQSDSDRSLFDVLDRPLPRWALIAPLPAEAGCSVYLYADNGARGMAARWTAEITLLVGRLRQRWDTRAQPGQPQPAQPQPGQPQPAQPQPAQPQPAQPQGQELSGAQMAVLNGLLAAAGEAGLPLEAYVERLHRNAATDSTPAPAPAVALGEQPPTLTADEVRAMLDGFARDIPKQLARGAEVALRQMAPRMAMSPASSSLAAPRAPRGTVDLVATDATPREVGHYRSRRKAGKRIKL